MKGGRNDEFGAGHTSRLHKGVEDSQTARKRSLADRGNRGESMRTGEIELPLAKTTNTTPSRLGKPPCELKFQVDGSLLAYFEPSGGFRARLRVFYVRLKAERPRVSGTNGKSGERIELSAPFRSRTQFRIPFSCSTKRGEIWTTNFER